jgi:hypothetical protein
MVTRNKLCLLCFTIILAFLAAGCGDDDNPVGTGGEGGTNYMTPLIGTWDATSFTMNGGPNWVSPNSTYSITINATTYTDNGTGDFCEVDSPCTESGSISADELTINVGGDSVNYTLAGTTLSVSWTDEDAEAFAIVFQKR